ncbi:MAG: MarR family transcriptional regulator [Clostridia bacterium]
MKTNDNLTIDNCLCFALYKTSREFIGLYKPYLDELGITYTQYITLQILWEKDGVTVKSLGERLHLDSGTLTPLLKRLEAGQMVQRVRDRLDERNVLIFLTDKGRGLKARTIDIPGHVLGSTCLTEQEAIVLKETLKQITKKA